MKWFSLMMLLLCLPFSQPAFALRCERQLIKLGDHKTKVSTLCGTPESIDRHIERRGVSDSVGITRRHPKGRLNYGQNQYREIEIFVEEWVYNFGSNRLRQYLRFENGFVTQIETLGRGD